MQDCDKYFETLKLGNEKDLDKSRYEEIKNLKCNDFRFFSSLAKYENTIDDINKAKEHIDKSIEFIPWNKLQQPKILRNKLR